MRKNLVWDIIRFEATGFQHRNFRVYIKLDSYWRNNILSSIFGVLIINFSFTSCASAKDVLSAKSLKFLQVLPFCEAKNYGVPPELAAGVVLAENELNTGLKDRFEDLIFNRYLSSKSSIWWEDWARMGNKLSEASKEARMISNKWPVSVLVTGYVISVGIAQITPRTALVACAAYKFEPSPCRGGVKTIVNNLFVEKKAVEIATIVLKYEKDKYQSDTNNDVEQNIATWATLYNLGNDYYSRKFDAAMLSNKFGLWIAEHYEIIKSKLSCAS